MKAEPLGHRTGGTAFDCMAPGIWSVVVEGQEYTSWQYKSSSYNSIAPISGPTRKGSLLLKATYNPWEKSRRPFSPNFSESAKTARIYFDPNDFSSRTFMTVILHKSSPKIVESNSVHIMANTSGRTHTRAQSYLSSRGGDYHVCLRKRAVNLTNRLTIP